MELLLCFDCARLRLETCKSGGKSLILWIWRADEFRVHEISSKDEHARECFAADIS